MRTARNAIVGTLVATLTVMPAWAGTIDTESALRSERERILVLLDRPEAIAALEARGVSASEARARVQALSDTEVAALASRMDTAPAGAGGNPAGIVLLPILVIVAAARVFALVLGLLFRAL